MSAARPKTGDGAFGQVHSSRAAGRRPWSPASQFHTASVKDPPLCSGSLQDGPTGCLRPRLVTPGGARHRALPPWHPGSFRTEAPFGEP